MERHDLLIATAKLELFQGQESISGIAAAAFKKCGMALPIHEKVVWQMPHQPYRFCRPCTKSWCYEINCRVGKIGRQEGLQRPPPLLSHAHTTEIQQHTCSLFAKECSSKIATKSVHTLLPECIRINALRESKFPKFSGGEATCPHPPR